MRIAALIMVLGLLGCTSGCTSDADPKYKADFERICHAEERSGASAIEDVSQRAMIMAEWLRSNIETEKARRFMATMAGGSPSSRVEKLRAEAKKAGVEPCPMARMER